ncbi:MAG: hypothetical protein F6K54_13155 [Okeania sp. SIO3B5]|uniref:hypothetical protein n=1 Tax=Okeania sp. SIO3B5 TaxID=2607811 RepID=UPI001400FB50|nr:hypothetical protein [Okeania sp. SIO3B5]NEO53942.1 hypothetical protein [Okeania sp. SIO3B5]
MISNKRLVSESSGFIIFKFKEEGRGKKEEGRKKKEEGRRKKEEGRRKNITLSEF